MYISGDTIYTEELATQLPKRFHIVAAILNLGKAIVPNPLKEFKEMLQITMADEDAARYKSSWASGFGLVRLGSCAR